MLPHPLKDDLDVVRRERRRILVSTATALGFLWMLTAVAIYLQNRAHADAGLLGPEVPEKILPLVPVALATVVLALGLLFVQLRRTLNRTKSLVDDAMLETQLAREEAERAVTGAPVAIFTTDADGRVKQWNDACAAITGYSAQEAIGQDGDFFFVAGDAGEAALEGLLASENEHLTRVVCKDGEERIIRRRVERLTRADGSVAGGIQSFEDTTEHAALETALVQSRDRLQLVLESSALGLWDWVIPENALTYNRGWYEILGYDEDDILPSLGNWKSLLHPSDYLRAVDILQAHLEGKTDFYESEYRLRHKAGHWVWVLDRGRISERDEDGAPLRACGTHLDITHRKQSEIERDLLLRQNEENIKYLRAMTGVAHAVASHGGLEELLGRIVEILPGSFTHSDVARCRIVLGEHEYGLPEDETTPWFIYRKLENESGVHGSVEIHYLEDRPTMDDGPFVREEVELLDRVCSMLNNAVQRIQSLEALTLQTDILERERTNLQKIFDSVQVGMILLDKQLQVARVNDAVADMLNCGADDLKQMRPGDALHCITALAAPSGCGSDPSCSSCLIRQTVVEALESGRTAHNVEVSTHVNIDGRERQLILSLSAAQVEIMESRHVLLSLIDMTESKLLEQQLTQSSKLEAVGQLASGIAHEINTPTQFVGDSVHFLEDAFQCQQELHERMCAAIADLPGDDVRQGLETELAEAAEDADLEFLLENVPKSLRRCHDGLGRIAKIVGAMKDFSHPGQYERLHADLNRAIEATLTIAHNEYKYVADLETDFGEIPQVNCNIAELNQVFLNIIVNAAHAIEDKVGRSSGRGTIRVRTFAEPDDVVIQIEDTGSGIPEGVRKRIFEPFFTTKDVGRGSGQGLSIAHSIVKRHDGRLDCESTEGEGTTFSIRLPIAAPQPEPSEESEHEATTLVP